MRNFQASKCATGRFAANVETEKKRHGAAALHDAGALNQAQLPPQGFGVRQPYAALEEKNRVPVNLCRPSTSCLEAIQIPNRFRRNGGTRGLTEFLFLGFFFADRRQFARIEPVTVAIRALVHFDPAFGAEEMAHQLDPLASRTISLARCIDDHIFVALNFEQMLSGAFLLLVNSLKLERVEPNAAATTLANVHLEIAHLPPGQFVEASWTLHDAISEVLGRFVKRSASLSADATAREKHDRTFSVSPQSGQSIQTDYWSKALYLPHSSSSNW